MYGKGRSATFWSRICAAIWQVAGHREPILMATGDIGLGLRNWANGLILAPVIHEKSRLRAFEASRLASRLRGGAPNRNNAPVVDAINSEEQAQP